MTATALSAEPKRGGLVVREGAALRFLPADVTVKVAPLPEVARVPGAPPSLLGIALLDGAIVPVVAMGDRAGSATSLIVCTYLGEEIALVGLEIVATGHFEADADGASVRCGGETARTLDLAAIFARLQSGPWAGRWRG